MQTLADDDVNMSISIRLFIITPAGCSIKSFLCPRDENSLSITLHEWNKRAADALAVPSALE
jgi:hypothetical protein